jgi:spore coat polysaccharide biosynthesis protein SpsF
MPSDKPLLDPEVVDKVVEVFNSNSYDYVTNFLPSTYPGGTEVEVLSFDSLKKSWEKAILPSEKEHVTNYIYNHRDDFRIFNVINSENLSNFRWAVDRIEDLRLVREIVSRIQKSPILIKDILELFKNEPSLVEINKQVDGNESNAKSEKEDKEFLRTKN